MSDDARALVEKLIDRAVMDKAAAVALLRQHPALLQARCLHDETPLHFCAVEGFLDAVRFFATAGMEIDAVNRFGDTALVDAVTLGHLEMVRLLLALGASPNTTSAVRGPVLHAAAESGNDGVVLALLDAGARTDYVTDLGESIWDVASRRGELAKVLKLRGLGP